MRSRPSVVAWLLAGLSAAGVIGDTIFTATSSPLLSEDAIAQHGWPLVPGAALGSSVMGALIVSSRPRHLIGWLLVSVGVTSSASLLTESYHLWALHESGGEISAAAHVAGWVSVLLGAPLALTCLTIMFLVAPDGHLLSRRWRYAAITSIAGLGLYSVAVMTVPPTRFLINDDVGVTEVAQIMLPIGLVLIGCSLVASVVSMVRRLRRAQGEVRQQLRWIAASAASIAFGLAWLFLVGALNGGQQTFLASSPLFMAYFFLPICTAVAVLRHRLFDIDLIINRAVILALATLIVATAYVALVVAMGSALGSWAEGFWPSLLVFVAVAMGFQPLRRRVMRLADRLAFGARAAPYDALAAFSRGLGDRPDAALLLPCVAEAAGQAVSARRATVRLELETGPELSRSWPDAEDLTPTASSSAPPDHEVAVCDRGGQLGSICVTMPPGRALRQHERQLLADLADQTAIAFRNARMEAELAAHVEALDSRTEELEASRRRLIEAGDAERRRLESAISRDVVPLLVNLPAALADVRSTGSAGFSSDPLDRLVHDATDALEALRELTRGVFPTLLARAGLGPALSSYISRTGHAATLVIDPSVSGQRFSARAEGAAYFCITEALPSAGGAIEVRLAVDGSELVVEVLGGAKPNLDVQAMVDRVEALGGSLVLDVPVSNGNGRPRGLQVRIPVEAVVEPEAVPALQESSS